MKTETGMPVDIGISESQRKETAANLSKFLADTYSLYLKTHYYHWNVTGPMFQTLHLMFEQHYTEMWAAVDVIAERIRALGFNAPGTYAEFSKMTSIQEDRAVPSADEMIRSLVTGHEVVIRTARSIFPAAEKALDQSTLDLLTQRMQIHEKTAWMLRSLIS